jgi:ketosteroid isomerase-like protein
MDGTAAVARMPSPFDELRRAFMDALGRRDARAAADVYAAEARILLPASRPMDGRAAIEAFWRAGLESGMSSLDLFPDFLEGEREFACEIGRYVLHAEPRDETAVVEEGRYLIVHRQEPDGAWRRALEILEPATGGSPT